MAWISQKVSSVSISVSATDNAGNPVMRTRDVLQPQGVDDRQARVSRQFTNGPPYPRVLRGTFADQIRIFRLPNTRSFSVQGCSCTPGPHNMDNFHVINPLEEKEDESGSDAACLEL